MTRRALLIMPVAFAGMMAVATRKEHDLPDAAEGGSGEVVRVVIFSDRGERGAVISVKKLALSDPEWRRRLFAEEFAVTRLKSTERAYTGRYWKTYERGLYRCVCCGNALFASVEKFDSGTGWPSFRAPVAEENIRTAKGTLERMELSCTKCDAHLGHVFDDLPPTRNLRYCINSAALRLISRGIA